LLGFKNGKNMKLNNEILENIDEFTDSSNLYLFKFDLKNDRFEFVSKSAEKVLDIPYEKIVSMSLQDLIKNVIRHNWNDIFREASLFINNSDLFSKTFHFDYEYQKDESIKWLRNKYTIYLDTNRSASHISGSVVDITDIKNSETEKESELTHYKSIYKNYLDGSINVDLLKNKIIIDNTLAAFINDNEQLEYTVSEFGKHLIDVNLYDIVNDKGSMLDFSTYKIRIKNKSRKIKDYIVKCKVKTTDEFNSPTSVSCVLLDITKSDFALTSNKAYLKKELIEYFNIGVALTDHHGTIIYWSLQLTEITGIQPIQVLGEKIWNIQKLFVKPENQKNFDVEQIKAEFNELLRNGCETRNSTGRKNNSEIRRKDNTIKYLDISRSVYNSGNEYGICICVNDITSSHIEKSSLESELNVYKQLIEYASEVYYFQDFNNSDNDYISKYIFNITGLSPEEFLSLTGEETINLIHHDEREIFKNYHDPATVFSQKPSDATIEYRIFHKNGYYIDISENIRVGYDEVGNPIHVSGSMRDVTERKMIENQLYDTLNKYKIIVNNQTDLVVKSDTKNKLTFVNDAYCNFFGMERASLIGKSFMPLIYKDDRYITIEAMDKLYEPPYECYVEQRVFSKNQWRWLAWKDRAILNENGEVVEIIGVGRDITDKKRIEEKFLQSETNASELINHHPMPVFISYIGSNIVKSYNKLAEEIFTELKLTNDSFNKITNQKYLDYIESISEENKNFNFIFTLNKSKYLVYLRRVDYNGNDSILHIITKL
jgi:PAS domain S-box-containing protein